MISASLEVANYIEQLDDPLHLEIELNEALIKENILPLPKRLINTTFRKLAN